MMDEKNVRYIFKRINIKNKYTDFILRYLDETKRNIDELKFKNKKIYDICNVLRNSDKVFLCGNGGSSSCASHISNDFQKMCKLKSICLTDSSSLITAWSNDDIYDDIFVKQLEILSDSAHDVIMLISGSGNSLNLIKAAEWGIKNERRVVAILGGDGGKIKKMEEKGVLCLHIDADMQHSEDFHMIVGHMIARMIYEDLQNNR